MRRIASTRSTGQRRSASRGALLEKAADRRSVASLSLHLSDDVVMALEAPYTPRWDWQGVSDEADMEAIRRRIPGMAP